MKKLIFLRIVNVFMILLFLTTAISMIFYRWIPGEQQYSEWLYKIHETAGVLFILVAVFHIILNWGWIRSSYLKKRRKK